MQAELETANVLFKSGGHANSNQFTIIQARQRWHEFVSSNGGNTFQKTRWDGHFTCLQVSRAASAPVGVLCAQC